MLYAVCFRMTGNPADAADATQDAMIAIVRNIDRFDGRSRFSTWSYRIAVNASLDELRRRRRRPEPTAEPVPVSGGPASTASGADEGGLTTPSFDTAVADRVDIDAALQQVPSDFRAAVVLRDLCTLDYAEIARVLDVPIGTVRSRIARGRAMLADLLSSGNRTEHPDRPTSEP